MSPPAESLVTSDQHGLIAVQMADTHAHYRVQLRGDGSLIITPEPQAQQIQPTAPKEAAPAAVAASPASATAPAVAVSTTPAVSSPPAASSQRASTSNAAPPAVAPAPPASSASDGWLQLNREAMQLLRGRPTRGA